MPSSLGAAWYSDSTKIAVELDGALVDQLSCNRVDLTPFYPELDHRAEAFAALDASGNIWAAIAFAEANFCERLFKSTNGGMNWTSGVVSPSCYRNINGFTILDNGNMVMALHLGATERPYGVTIVRSTDSGVTWQQSTVIGPAPYDYIGEGTMSVSKFSDGRVVLAAARWNGEEFGMTHFTTLMHYIFVSNDGGLTFSTAYATFEHCYEGHVIELQSGKILGVFRYQRYREPGETDAEVLALGGDPTLDAENYGQESLFKNVFIGESFDGGVTWENLHPLRDAEGNVLIHYGEAHGQLVQVPDGRVVLLHDYRACEDYEVRARVSWDDGQTWEPEIYHVSFGMGYPSSVALADGTIVTVTGDAPVPASCAWPTTYYVQSIRWQLPLRSELDADTDGISAYRDNCPQHYNPGQEDCDGDGTGDVCAIATGISNDCNTNAIPDECDLSAGTSTDCDGSHVPDECEGPFDDCDSNGIPDLCQVAPCFESISENKSPFGSGSPQSFTTYSPPLAITDVTLTFTAIGDLDSTSEYATIYVNSTPVGQVFVNGAHQCSSTPDTDTLVVPAATYNAAAAVGVVTINMFASTSVNSSLCDSSGLSSYIQVTVSYHMRGPEDCNNNGIPDACDPDADSDGVPDDCDACPATPAGILVDDQGCRLPIPGDFDGDLDVDLSDFGYLQKCLSGSGVPQNESNCQNAKLDGDNDVDGDDVALFLQCASGPNIEGDQRCAD